MWLKAYHPYLFPRVLCIRYIDVVGIVIYLYVMVGKCAKFDSVQERFIVADHCSVINLKAWLTFRPGIAILDPIKGAVNFKVPWWWRGELQWHQKQWQTFPLLQNQCWVWIYVYVISCILRKGAVLTSLCWAHFWVRNMSHIKIKKIDSMTI